VSAVYFSSLEFCQCGSQWKNWSNRRDLTMVRAASCLLLQGLPSCCCLQIVPECQVWMRDVYASGKSSARFRVECAPPVDKNHTSDNLKFSDLYISSTNTFRQGIFKFLLPSLGKLACSECGLGLKGFTEVARSGRDFECMRCTPRRVGIHTEDVTKRYIFSRWR
jgi:hypothetical protein